MQLLGQQQARASASPWGARAASPPLLLLLHGSAPVRHFLGGLAAAEPSKVYHERRLLGWTPEQLYAVVARVDEYSQFVPWCARSTVLVDRPRPEGGYLEAELEVGFQVFNERYTSKVTLQRPHRVHSSVGDSSLFDHLESTWVMKPGPTPGTTWLVFKVDFAFRSALYRHVADLFFDQVVKRMMGAFEGRCAQLYGPSSLAGGARRGAAAGAAAAGRQVPADHLRHYEQRLQVQQQQRGQGQQQLAYHHQQQQQQQRPRPAPGDRLEPLASAAWEEEPGQPEQQRQRRPPAIMEAPPGGGSSSSGVGA